MQLYLIDGVVVTKNEVIATGPDTPPNGLMLANRTDILGNIERTFLRFSVPIEPSRQCFDTF